MSVQITPLILVERVTVEDLSGEREECEQCARCGSLVAWEESTPLDLPHCLSGDWCDTHPRPGRENVPGAGRALPSKGSGARAEDVSGVAGATARSEEGER